MAIHVRTDFPYSPGVAFTSEGPLWYEPPRPVLTVIAGGPLTGAERMKQRERE